MIIAEYVANKCNMLEVTLMERFNNSTNNYSEMFLTLKRPTGASEAQVPIQNYPYPSIFIRSAQCFWYSCKKNVLNIPL